MDLHLSLDCDLDFEQGSFSVVQDIFLSCYSFKRSLIKFTSVAFKYVPKTEFDTYL